MAYAFTVDAGRRLVRVAQEGPERVQTALEAMRELLAHPEFRAEYGILCDFRGGNFPANNEGLLRMSAAIREFFPGQRIALVFSRPERETKGQFVAAASSATVRMRVFDSLIHAEAWLGAPAES